MRWVKLPQAGDVPVERSSHSIDIIGDKLYLFGGEHDPRVPIDSDVFMYDLVSGAWSKLTASGDIPAPRVGHTAAAIGTDLYLFGGRHGKAMGEGAENQLYKLDTTTGIWTLVHHTSGEPPEARSYHAMAVSGHKLYIFGGCASGPGGGRLSDLHEYDTETRAWRQLPAASAEHIPGRGGSCLVASGSSLFVICGFCGHELNDMHEFDLVKNTWSCPSCLSSSDCSKSSGLPARSVFGSVLHSCSACSHGDHIIAFGGEVDPSDKGHDGAGDFSGELFCFDKGHGWHKLVARGDKPCPRGWFAAATSEGRMVVHGGLDGNNERLGDLFMLDMHADE